MIAPKPAERTKKERIKTVSLKKQCENLWVACIYLRAGLKSELSGKDGELNARGDRVIGLNAHHIAHKSNHRLRFELNNGICITQWEHNYGVHGQYAEEYRTKIIEKIGQEKFDWLQSLKYENGKSDLNILKHYLREYLKGIIRFKKDIPEELRKVYLKQIGIE